MACIVAEFDPSLPSLRLLVAAPRGFCAGVDRAIQIVELALERYGAPVYVRHEIVHNRFVVDRLRDQGAVFVEELTDVPDDRPVVFSAHGVPKSVPAEARDRGLSYLDATCPLVSKVHRQAQRLIEEGRHILFIGHAGHPEVIGTFGQVPPGSMTLVETVEDVAELQVPEAANLSFLTQTTLSVDDTSAIVAAISQLRSTCTSGDADVVSTVTFTVTALRRDAGPARQVILPYFDVALRGGQTIAAKQVGAVALNFPAGSQHAMTRAQASIKVSRYAATLPTNVRAILTRPRKAGDADAAIDPLADPAVKSAVANATFEHLVGFQLTQDQIKYNATR
jgi:(E)-4-hydroxy-3-methyl-but-2-enyl pyrophosphate reductase